MVEINEMVLRVPGMNKQDGQSIGELVAGKMAEGLAGETGNKTIGELNVKLSLPSGISDEAMAEDIAQQVLNQLKRL